ncbi:MAG: ribosome biogenesis GTP-binding protein YihA/YsxC [Eubacteriales bacterium]|nr:ribosome biogenesis GTP-binding protein YihA/YsxC [Eubacteriales bacterium]
MVDPILQSTKFYRLIHRLEDLPHDGKPQIVLAGKSNVGKSSVINRLCGQKKLAKTSQAPGKTRNLIFFDVADKFYLVDLPGYGFSKSSQAEQERFSRLVDGYLHTDSPILLVLQLLDIRHDPTALDRQMLAWYQAYDLPYQIVLNKADKLSRPKQGQQVQRLRKKVKEETGQTPEILMVSAESGQGMIELSKLILLTAGVV